MHLKRPPQRGWRAQHSAMKQRGKEQECRVLVTETTLESPGPGGKLWHAARTVCAKKVTIVM